MIPIRILNIDDNENNKDESNRNHKLFLIFINFILFFLLHIIVLNKNNKLLRKNRIKEDRYNKSNIDAININNSEKNKKVYQKCYLPVDNSNSNSKIIHFITTRFLIEYDIKSDFNKILYSENYITNGIRVMKRYLFPSLESQSCKLFTWIIILGNKANLTYIKPLITFKYSFEMKIIYEKDFKKFLRNRIKDYDVLITTRIDYDDRIYYDAVNDVRKAINFDKPMILYGYNRGLYYLESNEKYFLFNLKTKDGCHSIFCSLVIILRSVNDTYTIYDTGNHMFIRKNLLESYKRFGIKKLDYDPAIFDRGDPKFVYVRQNYSHSMNNTKNMKIQRKFKEYKLNLRNFYGKH